MLFKTKLHGSIEIKGRIVVTFQGYCVAGSRREASETLGNVLYFDLGSRFTDVITW